MEPDETRIDLQLFDRYELDATEAVNEFLRGMAGPSPSMWRVDSVRTEWKVDGRGKLVWNVAEKRFSAMDLEAKIRLECICEMPRRHGRENTPPTRIRLVSDGTIRWTARARKPR